MQIWAESGKSALPICNYSQILYQFLTFTQNLKRSHRTKCPSRIATPTKKRTDFLLKIGMGGKAILGLSRLDYPSAKTGEAVNGGAFMRRSS